MANSEQNLPGGGIDGGVGVGNDVDAADKCGGTCAGGGELTRTAGSPSGYVEDKRYLRESRRVREL